MYRSRWPCWSSALLWKYAASLRDSDILVWNNPCFLASKDNCCNRTLEVFVAVHTILVTPISLNVKKWHATCVNTSTGTHGDCIIEQHTKASSVFEPICHFHFLNTTCSKVAACTTLMPNNSNQHLLIPFSETTMRQKPKQDYTAYHLDKDIASTMNAKRTSQQRKWKVQCEG